MVEVAVSNEPGRNSHKVPRVRTEIETEFKFGDSPIGLDGGPRIAFDRQSIMLKSFYWRVVEHYRRMIAEQ